MTTTRRDASGSAEFATFLLQDVLSARQRLRDHSDQTARRDVVRTVFAAMEGWTWIAREHVREVLDDFEQLTPMAAMALRELSYSVSETGEIKERAQGLPLTTVIRLVETQARVVCPDLSFDYSVEGWAQLRSAITVRNRITHPKPHQELTISDADLAALYSGFAWLLGSMEYVMASTNLALTRYSDNLKDLVQSLTEGDPQALADYQAALDRINGN